MTFTRRKTNSTLNLMSMIRRWMHSSRGSRALRKKFISKNSRKSRFCVSTRMARNSATRRNSVSREKLRRHECSGSRWRRLWLAKVASRRQLRARWASVALEPTTSSRVIRTWIAKGKKFQKSPVICRTCVSHTGVIATRKENLGHGLSVSSCHATSHTYDKSQRFFQNKIRDL